MKKCTNRRIGSAFLALLVLLFAIGVFYAVFYEKDDFYLEKFANADAKFYGEHIITSVDEGIQLLDFEGTVVKSYDGLKASWMYAYPEEGLVVYSNHDYETHLMKLDEEGNKRQLSKRKDPELSLDYYRNQGYHPAEVREYLLTILVEFFPVLR